MNENNKFTVETSDIFDNYRVKIKVLLERLEIVKFDPTDDTTFKQSWSETASYAAEISSSSKNAKSAFLILHLYKIKNLEKIDMTPTFAKNILREVVGKGKGVSFSTLLNNFGTEGRTSKDKSKDFEKIDYICEKYSYIDDELKVFMHELSKIRKKVK